MRPGKLRGRDDLMSEHGMVGHLLEFAGLKRAGFRKKPLVHGDLADIMKKSGGSNLTDFRRVHAQRLRHAGGVASYTQGMALHLYTLHVDGGSERGQSFVPERMHRSNQLQVL